MTTDDQAFDLVAAEDLRLSYTSVRDWTMLHPELRGTPFQLYAIMRSLVIDKAGDQPSRRITLDQLCWLLPGVNGKPTSLTVVKDALRALDRLGLVTNPDSERLVTSTGDRGIKSRRRFQINDLPPDGFRGWRNAWDKLDSYREEWRTVAPKPPALGSAPVRNELDDGQDQRPKTDVGGIEQTLEGRNSDHRANQAEQDETPGHLDGRNSDRAGRNSAHGGRNSVRQLASDQPQRAPKKFLKEGSLSTVASAATDADPTRREREPVCDEEPDPADLIVKAWADAWTRTRSGPYPVRSPDAVRRNARRLLADGSNVDLLCMAAANMAERGWIDLDKHLERWIPPKTPGSPAADTSGRTAADCRWCDPFGWYEHANGDGARCNHPNDPPAGHPAATNTRSAA
ncbi:hypothetical protein Caci_2894 [Catenulispora acidiphila DSM 44928]|uniref:Uncharacterized protein n=1 Tax=Catenulispora acidiphila (strain DSM 44928 / JCM 14897 / NBRC 102108 / NRRL B-24433 / ID139908) TaxID=479433 RepID=C7Q2R1_CATAD|nr:hypothetical protein [Catenulispora acidiphila]ACU71803.1 hypothetical protein Caci_2894 [Catenulispora acidiphila DSM 44928]